MPLYTHKFAASPQKTVTVSQEVLGAGFVIPCLHMVGSPEATLFVLFTAEAKLCPNSKVGGLF